MTYALHMYELHMYETYALHMHYICMKRMKVLEAVAQRCSVKNVSLEVHRIHRKRPVPESLF